MTLFWFVSERLFQQTPAFFRRRRLPVTTCPVRHLRNAVQRGYLDAPRSLPWITEEPVPQRLPLSERSCRWSAELRQPVLFLLPRDRPLLLEPGRFVHLEFSMRRRRGGCSARARLARQLRLWLLPRRALCRRCPHRSEFPQSHGPLQRAVFPASRSRTLLGVQESPRRFAACQWRVWTGPRIQVTNHAEPTHTGKPRSVRSTAQPMLASIRT